LKVYLVDQEDLIRNGDWNGQQPQGQADQKNIPEQNIL
jgi:hypothetical protein